MFTPIITHNPPRHGLNLKKGGCGEMAKKQTGAERMKIWASGYSQHGTHHANNAAVRAAYGFDKALSDEEIVARLMGLYEGLTGKKGNA